MAQLTSNYLNSQIKNNVTISLFKNKSKQIQTDHLKPIFVPFGSDSMESIGLPPLSASELNDPNHK